MNKQLSFYDTVLDCILAVNYVRADEFYVLVKPEPSDVRGAHELSIACLARQEPKAISYVNKSLESISVAPESKPKIIAGLVREAKRIVNGASEAIKDKPP